MPDSNRREFLIGRAAGKELEEGQEALADAVLNAEGKTLPKGGPTVRLATRAMACDFAVHFNEPLSEEIPFWRLSDALDRVHALEQQMTVYREDSEVMEINRQAATEPVRVSPELFRLLREAQSISERTSGAFDITSGPLIRLWQEHQREGRIPTEADIEQVRQRVGFDRLLLDEDAGRVRFSHPELSIDLGGIGKGEAIDRIADEIREAGEENFLLHGGYSSVFASGMHYGQQGWPVGLRDPLRPGESIGQVLLNNAAMSTSGSGVRFFRHRGRRYGHILDPRTGWPTEGMLSVTVIAPTSALADALSTAFFVLGVEKTRTICDNFPSVGYLLIPAPRGGSRLSLIQHRIPNERLFLTGEFIRSVDSESD